MTELLAHTLTGMLVGLLTVPPLTQPLTQPMPDLLAHTLTGMMVGLLTVPPLTQPLTHRSAGWSTPRRRPRGGNSCDVPSRHGADSPPDGAPYHYTAGRPAIWRRLPNPGRKTAGTWLDRLKWVRNSVNICRNIPKCQRCMSCINTNRSVVIRKLASI